MHNDKKLIVVLIFLLIALPFTEFCIDYYFGDKDGSIVRFNISKIINFFQFLILITFAIKLYKVKVFYCLLFIFIIYVIIDFNIIGRFLLGHHYEFIHRYPHPHVGFTGKPNKGKLPHRHNKFGFIGPNLNQAKSDDFTIAFFGGSTGYRGNPNLPIMIEKILKENNFKNGKVFISNFSVEASNHNQHLHMLTEFVLTNKVDLVIFYGGWNETVCHLYYDPRPGYHFNFFYTHDVPHWKKFLVENSKIFMSLQHKIVNREKFNQNTRTRLSEKWNKDIVENYIGTLNKANLVVNILEPNVEQRSNFIAFYQPFDLTQSPEIMPVHDEIKEKSRSLPWLHDINDVLLETENSYFDLIHIQQHARELVAEAISNLIIKSYSKK